MIAIPIFILVFILVCGVKIALDAYRRRRGVPDECWLVDVAIGVGFVLMSTAGLLAFLR